MKNSWISKHIRQIVIAVLIVGSVAGITVGAMDVNGDITKTASSQGIVFAKDISVNSKIPGRIVEFYVVEGQNVNVGDPLVKISSEEIEAKKAQIEAQIAQAKAGVQASEAVVEMAKSNYELAGDRVTQAKAGVSASASQKKMAEAVNTKAQNGARTQQVAQAEAAYNLYKATLERVEKLYEGGAVSLQQLEEVRTQAEVYKQTYEMAVEGARTEDKAAAAAQVQLAQAGVSASEAVLNQAYEAANIAMAQLNQAQAGLIASQGKLAQAEAGLQEVEVYLKDTVLTAPIAGTVTALNSDEGELVSTGSSIGTISNLDNVWVTVNLDENKLEGRTEGQSVDVKLLAYPDQVFTGTIDTINKQPDFAVKKATNENGNLDIVSFGVKIELDNSDEVFRPGMSAIVDFNNLDVK